MRSQAQASSSPFAGGTAMAGRADKGRSSPPGPRLPHTQGAAKRAPWGGKNPSFQKWLSTKGSAPHGAPRPDILSPWRRRLSLPIPCHVHWPRSCCRSRARAAAVCKKACFRGLSACTPGRVCSDRSCVRGARVRRGCAAGAWKAAWVRGRGAWRRGWAACVGRVPLEAERAGVGVVRAGA